MSYKLTAFEANGEKILDQELQAENDLTAKEAATKLLAEKDLTKKSYRFTSPLGKLLLFHS